MSVPPRTSSRDWINVIELGSMQECKDFIAAGSLLDSKGGKLSFVWYRKNPGNGKRLANFVCNSHKDCPVRVRAVQQQGAFHVQSLLGVEHSSTAKEKKRVNSKMTIEQEDILRSLVDAGTKPASIVVSLTTKEQNKSTNHGRAASKRMEGGLTGVGRRQHALTVACILITLLVPLCCRCALSQSCSECCSPAQRQKSCGIAAGNSGELAAVLPAHAAATSWNLPTARYEPVRR